MTRPVYRTIDATIGNTPLVQLRRLPGAELEARGVTILGKLEGNNPGGSVKDRPVLSRGRAAADAGGGRWHGVRARSGATRRGASRIS